MPSRDDPLMPNAVGTSARFRRLVFRWLRRAILLTFAGWFGLHLLINIPIVKNRAATLVANKLGVPGPVRSGWITFVPWNGWTVRHPHLGKKGGACLSADKLRLKTRWLPLLHKRLEILDMEWTNPSAVGLLSQTGVVTVPGGLDIDLLARLHSAPSPPKSPVDQINDNNVATPPENQNDTSAKTPDGKALPNTNTQATPSPPTRRLTLKKMLLQGGSFALLHPESKINLVSMKGFTVDWSGDRGTLQASQASIYDGQIVIENIRSPLEKRGALVAATNLQAMCNSVPIGGVLTMAPGHSALPFQVYLSAANVPLDLSTPGEEPVQLKLNGIKGRMELKGYARFPSTWSGSALGSFANGKITGSHDLENLFPRLDGGEGAIVIRGGYARLDILRLESPLITMIARGVAGGNGFLDMVARIYMDDKVRAAFSSVFLNNSVDTDLNYQQLFGRDGSYRDIRIRGRGGDAETNLMGLPTRLRDLPARLRAGVNSRGKN